MATHISFFCYLFLISVALNGFIISSTEGVKVKPSSHRILPFNRSSFPNGFIFGAGSAAYQVLQIVSTYMFIKFFIIFVSSLFAFLVLVNQSEGAAKLDKRGPSIWDTYTSQHPGFFPFPLVLFEW